MANLRIKGDVSGYVDLVSPDVAGAQTINLDRLVETNANGQITVSTDTEHQLTVQSATSGAGGSLKVASSGAYAYNVVQNANREWRYGLLGGSSFTITDWSAGPAERLVIDNSGNVGIGTTGPASTLEVYKSGTTRAYIGNTNNGHVFMSQSDVGYDGFQVYQQHGTNQDRNSFSVQDNRTGSKSPAFGVRGDGTVFVGRGAGSNNNQTSFNIGRGQTWPNMLHYMDLGGGVNHVNSTTSQYKIRMQIHRSEMYYKNVMVELFADSGYDWGGHGFCQYYGKFLVSFRDTTAHSIHVLENTGYNFLQGTGVYSYNGTSSFYDTNYYYVDFQFGSNQGGTPGFRPNFSAIGYQNHQLIYAIGVIN